MLVGYSSGAVFGAALLSVAPERFAGAVLLRPQAISDDFKFPDLKGKPLLVISGLHDDRRQPWHAAQLVDQLAAADASVTHHTLDAGHGWAPEDLDFVLARAWMDEHVPT
ncbi:MAG TPA: prolyl oligopeptidase family serine peptidase [Devosia sp.]